MRPEFGEKVIDCKDKHELKALNPILVIRGEITTFVMEDSQNVSFSNELISESSENITELIFLLREKAFGHIPVIIYSRPLCFIERGIKISPDAEDETEISAEFDDLIS